MSRRRGWTCQRVAGGVPCRQFNAPRFRLCGKCGKPKPAKRVPAHMAALDQPYEVYLELNGGVERCAICDKGRGSRRLDRDHDHVSGRPRGLLDHRCNRALVAWMTPEWLRRAADYLEARS